MIRRFLGSIMAGRNGPDQLDGALLVVAVVIFILSSVTGLGLLSTVAYVVLIYAFYRFISRNLDRRRAENEKFLSFWRPTKEKIRRKIRGQDRVRVRGNSRAQGSEKRYAYFSCPSCGNMLRVPKGMGRIKVTCPKCGERFEKKT